jgi:hypothetical protein
MLVLAIAAMIIVMSVRYYQSASSSQQANSVMAQISAIVAQAESLSQTTGAYTASTVGSTYLAPLLPTNGFQTPWGTAITTALVGPTSFTITVGKTPASVCPLVRTKLLTNSHFSSAAACGGAGSAAADMTFTYTSNP